MEGQRENESRDLTEEKVEVKKDVQLLEGQWENESRDLTEEKVEVKEIH